jgi:hypothetical protein
MHDIHRPAYDASPSCLHLSETGCEQKRILPTALSPDHTLWQLSPRVFDIHHVRLQPSMLARIIHNMPLLHTLCMNAQDTPKLDTLCDLRNLTSLCLYSVSDTMQYNDFGLLTQLQRLSFPVTSSFVAHVESSSSSSHDTALLPLHLVHLTLWRDPFDFDRFARLSPLNWTRFLASVPRLECLHTQVSLPMLSAAMKLVPNLRELCGWIHERTTTVDFIPPVPFAQHLTVLEYTSMSRYCSLFTRLLNPEALTELVWKHWSSRRPHPERLTPNHRRHCAVSQVAHFATIRSFVRA